MITQKIEEFCRKDAQKLVDIVAKKQIYYEKYDIEIDALNSNTTYKTARTANIEGINNVFLELVKKENCRPAVYVLELVSNLSSEQVIQKINKYREGNVRSTSALRKKYDKDAVYLYVGKVQKKFWERLITHLGFATNPRTGGLQIYHWLAGTGSAVRVHLYVFPAGMEYLVAGIEVQLAKELQPLIGKHK